MYFTPGWGQLITSGLAALGIISSGTIAMFTIRTTREVAKANRQTEQEKQLGVAAVKLAVTLRRELITHKSIWDEVLDTADLKTPRFMNSRNDFTYRIMDAREDLNEAVQAFKVTATPTLMDELNKVLAIHNPYTLESAKNVSQIMRELNKGAASRPEQPSIDSALHGFLMQVTIFMTHTTSGHGRDRSMADTHRYYLNWQTYTDSTTPTEGADTTGAPTPDPDQTRRGAPSVRRP